MICNAAEWSIGPPNTDIPLLFFAHAKIFELNGIFNVSNKAPTNDRDFLGLLLYGHFIVKQFFLI
jgi:hypothetical protein